MATKLGGNGGVDHVLPKYSLPRTPRIPGSWPPNLKLLCPVQLVAHPSITDSKPPAPAPNERRLSCLLSNHPMHHVMGIKFWPMAVPPNILSSGIMVECPES
jgi:hypothetical protein